VNAKEFLRLATPADLHEVAEDIDAELLDPGSVQALRGMDRAELHDYQRALVALADRRANR
jgi:hypothetical protein